MACTCCYKLIFNCIISSCLHRTRWETISVGLICFPVRQSSSSSWIEALILSTVPIPRTCNLQEASWPQVGANYHHFNCTNLLATGTMLQQNIYKKGILWETNWDLRLCLCLLLSLCIKYINTLELVWCLILLAYHPNVHMLYWVIMYLGLHVMQSDPSIYFTLVPVIPCVIISALPAENRRYTLKRLIYLLSYETQDITCLFHNMK